MSPLRRLSNVVRGRRLLAMGAFLFLGYLFANNLSLRPRYVVQSGGKLDTGVTFRGPAYWGTVRHLSDDGRQITVGVHKGDFRGYGTMLEFWDARTGTDRTPAHWQAADWQYLLTEGMNWQKAGLMDLLSNPAGREFLHDEAAWAALRQRLEQGRAGAVQDIRKTVRPVRPDEEHGSPFPHSLRFTRDGRFIEYVSRNGWPVHLVSESLGDGWVAEDVRTGERVQLPPSLTHPGQIGPGGQVTITGNSSTKEPGDQPRLTLWDLRKLTRRADLWLPEQENRLEFSLDGRYILAVFWRSELLRWWDVETGRHVTDAYGPSFPHFMDGSRLLVAASNDPQTFHFWDTATGRQLDDWDLEPLPNERFGRLTFAGDRFVLVEVYPNPIQPVGSNVRFLNRASEWMSERLSGERRWEDRHQVLVLDVVERRTLGRVPGVAGNVSPNGHWLATLDADGVVRVWELPIGRPWMRGFAYAAAIFIGGWVVFGLPRRLRRRRTREALAEHPTASPVA